MGFIPNYSKCWAKAHGAIILLLFALKDEATHSHVFQLVNARKVELRNFKTKHNALKLYANLKQLPYKN